ncbi:YggS family pyridoxal phosphate-dependent enzyme [Salana multivorans]
MPELEPLDTFRRYLTATSVEEFAQNLAQVRARIAAAAERAGRDADEVRLLPVSKTVPNDRVRLAVAAGCHELGENKVQEAARKHRELADLDVAWSVIGHLQTNKARDVAAFAAEFQALDSTRLAEALDRRLQAAGRSLDVYVQVNTSAEESKFGLEPAAVPAFLAQLPHYSALRVRGFMTLAVFSADETRVRECFRVLRRIRDEARDADPDLVGPGDLSMGMSGDYEIAVEEGATCVRVGQAIFGSRATPDSHYWPAAQAPANDDEKAAP